MEDRFTAILEGGRPWGFTLQGGTDFRSPLRVGKVTPGGRAAQAGLVAGDFLLTINDRPCDFLKHMQAQQVIINSPPTLELTCTKQHPVLASPHPRTPTSSFSFPTPPPVANGRKVENRSTPRIITEPIAKPKPPPVMWSSPAAKVPAAPMPVNGTPNGPPEEEEPKEEGPSVEVLDVQLEGIEGVSVSLGPEKDNGEPKSDHPDVGEDGGKQDWVMVEPPPPNEFEDYQTTTTDEAATVQEEGQGGGEGEGGQEVHKEEEEEKVPPEPTTSKTPPPILTDEEETSMRKKEPGWYKQMFQGLQTFQQTVDQTFPLATPTKPKETAKEEELDPTYEYDHRGLKVRSNSVSRSSSEGRPAPRHQRAAMRPRAATSAMTKEEVMAAVKRSTTSKTAMATVGERKKGSQDYWKKIEEDSIEVEKEKRKKQEIRRSRSSSEKMSGHTSPDHYTTKSMHPLLRDAAEEERTTETKEEKPNDEVFNRIDASKLHGAMENAMMLGTLEQEGVPSAMLPLVAQMKQASPEPQKKEKHLKPPPGEKGRALFDFDAQSPKEISFKKGDIVTLTHTIDANWLEGAIDGRKGILPHNYVKILTPEELRALCTPEEEKPKVYVVAIYDFDAQNTREMSFSKGEVITIIRQIDANWYEGCYGDQKGIFPVAYAQIMEEGSE